MYYKKVSTNSSNNSIAKITQSRLLITLFVLSEDLGSYKKENDYSFI